MTLINKMKLRNEEIALLLVRFNFVRVPAVRERQTYISHES